MLLSFINDKYTTCFSRRCLLIITEVKHSFRWCRFTDKEGFLGIQHLKLFQTAFTISIDAFSPAKSIEFMYPFLLQD